MLFVILGEGMVDGSKVRGPINCEQPERLGYAHGTDQIPISFSRSFGTDGPLGVIPGIINLHNLHNLLYITFARWDVDDTVLAHK